MFWKRPDFLVMQRDWYDRLKELGFADEERLRSDGTLDLKATPISRGRVNADDLAREMEYVNAIMHCIEAETFEDGVEAFILQKHANGYGTEEIRQALLKIGESRHRHTIRTIVRRYEHKWKIKQYTRRQLTRK